MYRIFDYRSVTVIPNSGAIDDEMNHDRTTKNLD